MHQVLLFARAWAPDWLYFSEILSKIYWFLSACDLFNKYRKEASSALTVFVPRFNKAIIRIENLLALMNCCWGVERQWLLVKLAEIECSFFQYMHQVLLFARVWAPEWLYFSGIWSKNHWFFECMWSFQQI